MTLKTQPFEAARFLEDDEAVAVFITSILEENNPALLAAALGEVAKARGMAQVAEKSGMAREALYKALRSDSQPRFETIARVCAALGVKLVAQPAHG
ncbi:MAG: putative addiction module antidote protein [Pseudomonas sp.]|jgi:probable addiction module antidote protein|nr:MAG: putative addiction module antidote protein [Pseudomonas sp.]